MKWLAFINIFQDLPLYLERRITIVAGLGMTLELRIMIIGCENYGMAKVFQDTSSWLINEATFLDTME